MNNGNYYADRGFACAAAGKSIPEALREHLNIIIRDENLEITCREDQLQEEIDWLVADKDKLETKKINLQESLQSVAEGLSTINVEVERQKVELESPVQAIDSNLHAEIKEKTLELDYKRAEKVKIKTDLEAPTVVELDPDAIQATSKQGFSLSQLILAIFATVAIVGLFSYLYIFYVSAGEKIVKTSDELNLERLIDYEALERSWNPGEGPRNWLVLTFPLIFIVLAIVTHLGCEKLTHLWKNKESIRWTVILLILLVVATLTIEGLIGQRIAHQIIKAQQDAEQTPDSFRMLFLLFLFLGFGVSLLLGFGSGWILELWGKIRPQQDASDLLQKRKRMEQNDRLIQLATLNTNIPQLENHIGNLNEEIITRYRHPIETNIRALEAEKENLQDEIELLNEQINSFQKEINQCESDINALLESRNKKAIDLKKMEAQAREFITGWYRYVAQRETELSSESSSQTREIEALAHREIEAFKASLKIA